MGMNDQELLKLLSAHEWNDVEFKEAKIGVPKNAYESVSAFANTEGGHLVFGVKKDGSDFEVVGILDVDKVQNEFLSSLRQKDKISQIIDVQEHLHKVDEKDLLVFYIPESSRFEKPVYLNGNFQRSFLRKGACDVKCSHDEMKRLLRDASNESYDSETLAGISVDTFYDEGTVNWYRKYFNQQRPGRHETLSDQEFLLEWGFMKEVEEKLAPTRTAVLLFGRDRYVRQILPRAIVDYQRIDSNFVDWTPEKRWDDRVVFEENIIQTWLGLVEKYMRLSESSFSVDSKTLRRNDDPPDYISFREAAINLLIHQDYGDHSRKPVIKFFKDKTIFWNPGDAFVNKAELLEASEKEVRNPSIVNAFRRIGLSDQAGTGIRSIFNNWNYLGNTPPEVINNKSAKTFELSLLKEKLLSEEQIVFRSSIGVHLSPENASVFAYACKHDKLTLTDIKAITGKTTLECRKIGDYLVVQVLLQKVDDKSFEVAEHLKARFVESNTDSVSTDSVQVDNDASTDLTSSSVQVDAVAVQKIHDSSKQVIKLTENHRLILKLCQAPRSLAELLENTGYSNRGYFKKNFINALISSGLIKMTKPDKPNASDQKYVLTDGGFRLVHED